MDLSRIFNKYLIFYSGLLCLPSCLLDDSLTERTFFEVESLKVDFTSNLDVLLSGTVENIDEETKDILSFEIVEKSSGTVLPPVKVAKLEDNGRFESEPISNLSSELVYEFRAIAQKGERRDEGDFIDFSYADLFQLNLDNDVQVDNQQAIIQGSITGVEERNIQFDEYGLIVSKSDVIDYGSSDAFNPIGELGLDVFFKDTIYDLDLNSPYNCWIYLRKGERVLVGNPKKFETKGGWSIVKQNNEFRFTNAIAIAIGEDIYFGLGDDDPLQGSVSPLLWKFNINAEEPEQLATFLGKPRVGAIAFEIEGIIYFGLGFSPGTTSEYHQDLWSFNPTENKWEELEEDAFIGIPRAEAVVFKINNKAYIGTGRISSGNYTNDFYCFDPTAENGLKWKKIDDLPGNSRENAVAFSMNENGFIGLGNGSFNKIYNDFYQFSPTENGGTWIKLPVTFDGIGLESAIGFTIQNRGYIALGVQKVPIGSNVNQINYSNELFEFKNNQFLKRSSFIGPARSSAAVAVVNQETAYVIGGEDEDNFSVPLVFDDLVKYTPAKE